MANDIIKIVLGSALVVGLFATGWRIYHRLPGHDGRARAAETGDRAETELTIVLRLKSSPEHPTFQLALYPFDIQELQREFSADPHSGKQFDDFLAQRMRGQAPVRVQLDDEGRAIAKVAQGNWWIHARLASAEDESAEWRLPIRVAGSKQTIELTPENAYEWTKKF